MSKISDEPKNIGRNRFTMPDKLSYADIKKLLPELQAHQIKLEMKHDVLIRHHKYLMKKVKDRTHELQSINEELEQKIRGPLPYPG